MDTGLEASKIVTREATEGTGQVLGNKIAKAVAKVYNDNIVKRDENSRNVKEIIIPPEKREEILTELRQVL